MARPPHADLNKHSSQEPSSAKPAAGFLSWVKKTLKFFRRSKRSVAALSVKRDIDRLERERAKERGALLKQRRFYEGLVRRRTKPPIETPIKIPPPVPNVPKPLPPVAPLPPIEKPAVPIAEIILPKEEPKEEFKEEPKEEPIVMSLPEKKPEPAAPAIPVPAPAPTSSSDMQPPKAKTTEAPALLSKIKSVFAKSSLAEKLAEERKQEESTLHKSEVEERSWQPYNSVKANLLKDQGVLFFNWQQKILTLSLALVLCSLAIGLVYVGLLIWQKERLDNNQAAIANFEQINAEILKNEREISDIIDFNRKLDLVSFVLTNHVYWSNFLAFLEANTLKDVYYESLSADLTGKYVIPAVARSLDAVSLQLEVMKAYNLMRTVQYSGGQTIAATETTPASVKFNLEMSVDPKIFLK